MGAYYYKYKNEVVSKVEYNYSKQDSLFWNNSNREKSVVVAKKKVDYEQELYDFSGDELESVFIKININTAYVDELILLTGIVRKTAEKIVKYRENNGKFNIPSDLLNVSGIGKKKLEKIISLIIIE